MTYKCSMQKKIERVTKRNEWYRGEHADIFDDIRRDTSNSWYIGATRMMPRKSGAVTGAIEDDDYRDRFVINFTAACDNFDFGQNSEELKELADTCLSMAITDRSPRTKGDMLVTAVPLGNPVVKGNSWNYDVELKYNDTQKGETKMTCSMQKKIESLKKKSKKCEGLLDDLPYDAPVAIESLCAEIMSHTEEFTIEDADVAEMCGKWYIRSYADGPTAAQNEDEWVDEVLTGLSGSPVDGSPFGVSEAEGYARKIYNEVVA